MKKLMLGNEAVARGIYEAGVSVVSSYPGTPSTEITEEASKYNEIYCEWAPNEKVAMETAFGASLAGKRSACCMKHVGLNVAADPLYTMSYTGVNAGLLVCVADDPGMFSSQNEQDSRHHAIAAKIPMLEPSDAVEAKEFAKIAFTLSEEYDTPVILRMNTRIAHSQWSVETEERVEPEIKTYVKNPQKYVMSPANAIKKHPFVEERTEKLRTFAENCEQNRVENAADRSIGIITAGPSYNYVKEVFGDTVSVLKLGIVNPLPVKLIKDFAASVNRLFVVEELDPIIENHCKELGLTVIGKDVFPMCGEYTQDIVRKAFGMKIKDHIPAPEIPVRPPAMCSGCPHRGLFYVLSKNRYTVLGDIGCYTLGASAPLFSGDSVLCMGASIPALHGFNKALGENAEKKTVCVIGDSTFMHSGMTGLVNASYNSTASTVIILDNSITGMTGHQQNPLSGYNLRNEPATKVDLEALCKAVGVKNVRVVDPYNIKETETVIREEIQKPELSVVISRRPCVLLKSVKTGKPMIVEADKCRSCKLCMKIGCPSISMKEGKAHIDATLCTGCKVCAQMCSFDAITGGDK